MKYIIIILSLLFVSSCSDDGSKEKTEFFKKTIVAKYFQKVIWKEQLSCHSVIKIFIIDEYKIRVDCQVYGKISHYKIIYFRGEWIVIVIDKVDYYVL